MRERLIQRRLEMGYKTQQQFADALGIGRAQYNRIENGKSKRPRHSTIYKIAALLRVDYMVAKEWLRNN